MFKVLPCSLLLVLTTTLLWKLSKNKRRRDLLIGKSIASRRSSMIGDRTTRTLLVLLTIFIITELPQGIMAFLNGLFPNDIHHFVYLTLGEMLDLLSLINCNTCFIVYPL
ncbi:Protein DMSR-6, partial [Aphelenchoides avenae]